MMKELLTTLASGDNFSKVLMVIVLLLSGTNFFKIGNQADETRANSIAEHERTRAQIEAVYNYQQHYIDLIKGIRKDNQKVLSHLGLGDTAIPEAPQLAPLPNPTPTQWERDYNREYRP